MDFGTPSDGVTDRIDEALDADTASKTTTMQADTADDDPEPDSLEARVRLLAPGHAYWTRGSDAPSIVQAAAQAFGAEIRATRPVIKATWSTPEGVWMVGFQQCHASAPEAPTYHLSIDFHTDGNGIDLYLEGQTPDEVVEVLTALHAIRG